ncbi:MAG: hypothetical protein HY001_04210 [Candidatus Portnoybacteria bacterium]|nr:hypothetical protein [Candidatus Portnoybacteria bacterium]
MTMTKAEQTKLYETTDLALVSVILLFLLDALEVVNRENPHRVVFGFKKSDKLDNLVARFWERKLKIEPRAFFDGIKTAKARIYSEN